jgi:hypothetical protein
MNVTRDITSALQRAAYGCVFNVILLASIAAVRDTAGLLSQVVVGLGLAGAVAAFVLLSLRASQRVRRLPV